MANKFLIMLKKLKFNNSGLFYKHFMIVNSNRK
jgi:hypothetical protein